jgi:tRNA threonylcarbamoyladenosine biosynthesis protein TsaB
MDWSGGLDALERLDGPAVSAPDLVAEADVVTGPGATAHAAVLRPAPGGPAAVDPVVLARLAALRAARGEDVSPEPLYLRRPDVQAPGPAKRATEARR